MAGIGLVKIIVKILLLSVMACMLCHCSCNSSGNFGSCGSSRKSSYRWDPSSDENRLPRKIKGASDQQVIRYRQALEKSRIKVISMGQNNLISIPSSLLFTDESPQMMWNAYAPLNQVVQYLKQFRTVSIHIRSFSSKYVSAKRDFALTSARSRAVADYFVQQGVDSRLIFTSGLGSDKPIMRVQTGGDESGNSRVEITFREQLV